jgi:hypothetical protein
VPCATAFKVLLISLRLLPASKLRTTTDMFDRTISRCINVSGYHSYRSIVCLGVHRLLLHYFQNLRDTSSYYLYIVRWPALLIVGDQLEHKTSPESPSE